MGRFRLCTLLSSTAFAALLLTTPASAYTPGTSSDFFGVNGAFLRNFVSSDKAASLDGLTASMGQQGIAWARITFDQSVEERTKGTFNWYVPDTMIASLARHGVRGAGSFVGTAGWDADPNSVANCGSRAAPGDLTGWSQWVSAAARRYGSNGTFWTAHPELPKLPIGTWEIGNEVNSGIYWCPAANPEQYASVYAASASAIKAADDASQVIVAGLAPRFGWQTSTDLDAPSFLNRMIAADPSLAGSIPAVAIHPYAATAADALKVIAQFRRAMRTAGMPNTPMLANEIGWYTQGAAGPLLTTQTERANQISAVANQLWRTDCGIQGLAPYSWITMQQDPSNSEDWYGLADPATGAPNEGGLAYGQQIRLALGQGSGPPPQDILRVCGPKSLTAQKSGSGAITSGPAGIDCGATCTATFDDASRVTLTANPSPGYRFTGWSGCGSVSGNQCTLTMTEDRSAMASFVAQRTLTAQKTGSGTVASWPAGISCGSTCSAAFDDGTQVTVNASPASGYAFRGWSGCDSVSGNQCTVAMGADKTVGANFVAQRTLTAQRSGSGVITSTPAGIICGPACNTVVDDGAQITLTATPSSGYVLSAWSGCDSVSGSQCTVTMGADTTVNASFALQRSLTAQSTGAGTIVSSPAGVDCGSACTASFDYLAQVTLTASPAAGYAFRSWTGCTSVTGSQCTVSMSADTTVSADFVQQRKLTAEKFGDGTITSSPAGIDCGTACAASYDDRRQLTLIATPAAGSTFRGWSGCTSVSGKQCTIAMSTDATVSADFVALRTLTAQKSGLGTLVSSPTGISCGSDCTQVLDDGTAVALTATPATGYRVEGWSGCDTASGNLCHVTMDGDSTVSADIEPIDPPETRITAMKVVRRARTATFAFTGDQGTGPLTYGCRIDNRAFKACSGQASYATPGKHTFQVIATDQLGRTDPTPATRTFTIRRR